MAKAFSTLTLNGHADTYSSYACWNAIYNTSYRPCYYHVYYRLKEAGFNNNYGHAMGLRLYSSWNAATAANARTIKIEILETYNCTFTFFDSMLKYASIPGTGSTNYNTYSEFNFTDNGLIETGDQDTTGRDYSHYGYMTNSSTFRLAPYMIFGLDRENHPQGVSLYSSEYTSSTTSVNTARVYNTTGIDWTRGLYYSNSGTNFAKSADLNFSPAVFFYALDFRYTDNCIASTTANGLGLVPRKAVYFRGVIKEDGLFYFAPMTATYNSTSYQRTWTQDIPTSVETDGTYQYVYWFIGFPYYTSSYAASLYQVNMHSNNKMYWYHNGRFEEYQKGIASHSYTPAGTIGSTSITPAGSVSTTVTVNTTTVNSITAVGTLPTHAADTFSAGTLPSFTQGTFTAGTLPSLTMSVDANEVLSFSWNAGTQSTHAADTFSAGTLPSYTQGTFSQGTLPTKGTDTTVATGINTATSTFTGTAASHSHTWTGTAATLAHSA